MSKVIELTVGEEGLIKEFYPDDEIVTYNPYPVYTSGESLPFEDDSVGGVFAHHVLNKISWRHSLVALKDWARILIPETAALHVIVPSQRWLGKMLMQEVVERQVRPLLFGEQTSEFDIGKSVFSIRELRIMFDLAGLAVIKAKVGAVEMLVGEKQHHAEQLYVVGLKREWSKIDEPNGDKTTGEG